MLDPTGGKKRASDLPSPKEYVASPATPSVVALDWERKKKLSLRLAGKQGAKNEII
jgi:hypothetical protein